MTFIIILMCVELDSGDAMATCSHCIWRSSHTEWLAEQGAGSTSGLFLSSLSAA